MRALWVMMVAGMLVGCSLTETVSDPGDDGEDAEVGLDAGVDVATDTRETEVSADGVDDARDVRDAVDASDTVEPVDPGGPTHYPSGRLHSPISPFVAENLRRIAAQGVGLKDDVFMKVGASSTISTNYLHCFAGTGVDFDGRSDLDGALTYYLGGDAAGVTPFDRVTLAAKSGRSAVWAITPETDGTSPLEKEIAAISPRYAVIAYGTNDMQLGTTYQSAIWNFASHIFELTDGLIAEGIVPILINVPPRTDAPGAMDWVPSYNAVILGLAQGRQVPYFDFYAASLPLPGYGLRSDELHGTVYSQGPCVFTAEGLTHRMNMRNLETLVALDRVKAALVDGVDSLDTAVLQAQGAGTGDDPIVIEGLPFTDVRDTRDALSDAVDAYPGCSATQNESGSEVVYRLELTEETRLRAMVFDQGDVDIDLHVLSGEGVSGEACLERDHQIVQRTLPAGSYTFVLDTFVSSSGVERSGEYLFAVHACTASDPSCD